MNAQAILQKIEDDALEAAKQTKADAEKRAGEIQSASRARVESMRDEMVKQANEESEALAGRMRRMAELDLRKHLLQKKRAVIDEAFAAAQAELCKTPAAEARAFLLRQAAAAAQGVEALIIGENNMDWFDDAFTADLNAALDKAGKPAKVILAGERRAGVTGVILSHGGTEVYCTFEAMLEGVRAGLETEIAQILFND